MTKRVIIVGIPGVGKSTVITNILNTLSKQGIDIKVAEFGTIMFEQAKLLSILNRDELRKLSLEQQKSLQEMTANYIFSLKNEIIIIDTHLFINTAEGYYPGIPNRLLNILNPSHLILLTANSNEVYERRKLDIARQRDLLSEDEICDELKISKIMIASSSIFSGCPFSVIPNNNGQLEEATNKICKMIIHQN
ncbi:MAG: adenylate kinase [Thermoproteota archaeon]|nr:adenylate kinase [Thermoproteota archaeon]